MAESILPIAEMLTKLLIKEAAFLKEVQRGVEYLAKELKDIGSDLKKADVMTNREEDFDEWVSQLRDLAFKAEDVIEVFVNNATPYDGCDIFQLIMGCFCQIITLHKLESEINDIEIKLNHLPARSLLLTIRSPEDGETSTRHHRDEDLASSRRDEDDDMVGFEKEAKELTSSLKKEEPQGQLLVISIWAQAGAGKTALARNIYKRSDVSSQFDCVAWVSVSQEYEVKDIWQAILEQVKKLTEEEKKELQQVEDPHGLRDIVHNYLKGKSYLIVLDDLWKQKDWEIISKAFPKSPQKKCRVLLTTRIEEVARVANPSTDPETLRVLNEDESLELFLKKVFGCSLDDSLSTLSKEMEDVAKQMLARCEGLPIAIVLLGGILSAKRKDIFEWTEMLGKFRADLIESTVLRKVFSLSYNDLPSLSKPCFLYFGLFPEDSVIDCDKLIRLWAAEGFLEQRDNEAMEDVGRECLKGLIQRSMVQVVDRKSNGDPQTCRTHDLVRSFVIQEAKKAKFSNISKKKQLISVVEGSRRIALHPEDIDFFHVGTSSAPSESNSVNLSHPLFWLLPSRMRPSFVEGNYEPVGIQDDADQLASRLIKGKPLGRLDVVSIIGTAGIGKTTLARKIYHRSDVKSHFSCRAWINVSQGYVVRDLLQTLIRQVTTGPTDAEVVIEDEKDEEEEEEELLRKLHKYLEEQPSYLIVLDNIWRQEDWDIMERVFPKPLDVQKCRVLLTTPDSLVARYINPSGASLLQQTLDKKNSMKLFLQTLFKCSQDQIPSEAALFEEMIEMAGKFLKLSGGIPLLIVLLGGLLSVKRKSVSVWLDLLEIFSQYEGDFVFMDLITFCYDDLPGYLRSCFLYLRLFPEDTEIECDTLIQLWVVEGFLKLKDNKTMEDVARDCLEELIQRNLIEVTKRKYKGAPVTCRIHGLLRDFAKYESIEARFSKIARDNQAPLVLHPKTSELHGSTSSALHFQPPKTFSLMNDIISFLEPFKFPNHVHSLICFSKTFQFLRFGQQFPLLRVLDLEGVENMDELPYEIRSLILLRYLSLRGTRVKLIPSWIAKLRNLQTLDAPGSKIPIDTLKLHQLRHLFADSFYFSGSSSSSVSLPLLIDVLEHLQSLELDIGDCEIGGLQELTNLRLLRLHCRCGDDTVVRAIAYLKSLKFFSLTKADTSPTPMLHLPSLLRHRHLNEVVVVGTITEANDFPPHLSYLWLENSLENGLDPFFPLQKLRFLKKLCLRLFEAESDAQIPVTFFEGGFPKLEYLYIRVDFQLRNWTVERGALPSLRVLHIEGDETLGELPDGLKHIKTLKELIITRGFDVRDELMYGGKERDNIKDLDLSIKYLDESSVRP